MLHFFHFWYINVCFHRCVLAGFIFNADYHVYCWDNSILQHGISPKGICCMFFVNPFSNNGIFLLKGKGRTMWSQYTPTLPPTQQLHCESGILSVTTISCQAIIQTKANLWSSRAVNILSTDCLHISYVERISQFESLLCSLFFIIQIPKDLSHLNNGH